MSLDFHRGVRIRLSHRTEINYPHREEETHALAIPADAAPIKSKHSARVSCSVCIAGISRYPRLIPKLLQLRSSRVKSLAHLT